MPKTRLEAFSDGVFAIVITLLVLELRPEQGGIGAREMIAQAEPKILAFMLSFVIIGTYWVAHHRMLHFVESVDRTLLWLNLALLMVITFMPYPTALIGTTHGAAAALRLYGVTLITANAVGTALWWYGTRPAHSAKQLESGQRLRAALIHLAPIVIYIVGIGLASAYRDVALACYAAVPAFFIVLGSWVDRKFIHFTEPTFRSKS